MTVAYDDEKYIRARIDLVDAVHELLDNEVPASDVQDMVEQAIDEHEPEAVEED